MCKAICTLRTEQRPLDLLASYALHEKGRAETLVRLVLLVGEHLGDVALESRLHVVDLGAL